MVQLCFGVYSEVVECIVLQLHPATGDDVDQRYVCMTLRLDLPPQVLSTFISISL